MTYTLKSAVSPQVLRTRRTWCYSVIDDNGNRVGILRKHRQSWSLNIKGMTFTPSPGSLAAWAGIKRAPCKGFKTVAAARTFLKELNPLA